MNSKVMKYGILLVSTLTQITALTGSKNIWELSEPKEVKYEDSNGLLKFTYWTFVNEEYEVPRPFLKGKFEITDKRS